MPIEPGQRLLHYEIVEKIGEGGMGVVWKAVDTTLDREIALKVLPAGLADDQLRLNRFEREARLLASLSHPHIAVLHGLHQADDVRFLTMELVDGEDLLERLRRGPMTLDETLRVGLQIAEALEAAHRQGVVHRDLKPANIKLTADGEAKVLDFGLAKALYDEPPPSSDLANSPTMTAAATRDGVLLGTPGYMAPEQVRGGGVDARADVWAFGVVLYEMLTASRTFPGDTVSDTLAKVLEREPDWKRLPPRLPGAFRRMLRRCLTKDVATRLQAVGEARIVIQEVLADPTALTFEDGAEAARATPQSKLPKLPWVLAGVASFAAIALSAALWRAPQTEERPLVRLNVDLGHDVSLASVVHGRSVIITRDGTRIAYLASVADGTRRLYTRRLDQQAPSELAGTENAQAAFFSPDGEWIGFFAGGRLSKISVDGGAVVPLGDLESWLGGTWGDDGMIVVSGRGLLRISEDGGDWETLLALGSGESFFGQPQILPGGRSILFSSHTQLVGGQVNVEIFSLEDGVRTTLVEGATNPRYLPSGHLVFASEGTLFAAPFDLKSAELVGSRVPVLDGLTTSRVFGGVTSYAFSRDGTLVYRSGVDQAAALMVGDVPVTVEWLDEEGNREPLISEVDTYREGSLSPDGERVALSLGPNGDDYIAIYDPGRDSFTRLTFESGDYGYPIWSPDGQHVIFSWSEVGLAWARSDAAGPPELLWEKRRALPGSVSSDWQLAYSQRGEEGGTDTWTVAIEKEGHRLKAGEPELFLANPFDESIFAAPQFSPDGRWLAYNSRQSGRNEVSVRKFPPSSSNEEGRVGISTGGGARPQWSPDTQELFYAGPGGAIMVVDWRVEGDRFIAGRPRVWAAQDADAPFYFWDMGPGGRALVVVWAETDEVRTDNRVVFLQNFLDYLRSEVPTP